MPNRNNLLVPTVSHKKLSLVVTQNIFSDFTHPSALNISNVNIPFRRGAPLVNTKSRNKNPENPACIIQRLSSYFFVLEDPDDDW
jgi:hypothetical protein